MNLAYIFRYDWESSDDGSVRASVEALADARGHRIDEWVTESGSKDSKRRVAAILRNMKRGDCLYVGAVTMLGNSLKDIISLLSVALKKGVAVYGAQESFSLDGISDVDSCIFAFESIVSIAGSISSSRAKAALKARKDSGAKLGRPVGSTSKMDILFRNKEAIDRDISKGTSIADLCRRYKISYSTFKRFQKARQGA